MEDRMKKIPLFARSANHSLPPDERRRGARSVLIMPPDNWEQVNPEQVQRELEEAGIKVTFDNGAKRTAVPPLVLIGVPHSNWTRIREITEIAKQNGVDPHFLAPGAMVGSARRHFKN
jgi:hypothetical protein